ncbi:MAG: hypothetical protein QNJ98_17480 [Planctomycetota bacterium]|nr:hypothetical protein [Planctomycetota bacterium]
MRAVLVGLTLLVLGGIARAEPTEAQRNYEIRVVAHFQRTQAAVERLEAAKTASEDARWAEVLAFVLVDGASTRSDRPEALELAPARKQALDAWAQAAADTEAVYEQLRGLGAKATDDGPSLRTRARGLCVGYRNACRSARAAFATPELEAAVEALVVDQGIEKAKLEAPFTKVNAHLVCRLAGAHVRRLLAIQDPSAVQVLTTAKPDAVLVVEGAFDHASRVLDALRVSYRRRDEDRTHTETFRSPRVVVWTSGEGVRGANRKRVMRQLRSFVERGGYLLTTDWSVVHVLEEIVPGALKSRGPQGPIPEMVLVPRAVATAKDHPLLRGVFLPGVKPKWWLENAAFDVTIGPRPVKGRVVLVEIEALATKFKRGPVAAVTFPRGKGRVLHVLPQAYQQMGNLAGVMAHQRLLLNFVVEGLRDPD